MVKNSRNSSKLILAKINSLKVDGLSQPRVELFAATMNVHTREIVRRVLQENHKGKVKLTDSQVVLYWLCNHKKAVKKWVRNQGVEVFRFTDSSRWFFISSHNVTENLGTKRVADMRLVDQNSTGINGLVG